MTLKSIFRSFGIIISIVFVILFISFSVKGVLAPREIREQSFSLLGDSIIEIKEDVIFTAGAGHYFEIRPVSGQYDNPVIQSILHKGSVGQKDYYKAEGLLKAGRYKTINGAEFYFHQQTTILCFKSGQEKSSLICIILMGGLAILYSMILIINKLTKS